MYCAPAGRAGSALGGTETGASKPHQGTGLVVSPRRSPLLDFETDLSCVRGWIGTTARKYVQDARGQLVFREERDANGAQVLTGRT